MWFIWEGLCLTLRRKRGSKCLSTGVRGLFHCWGLNNQRGFNEIKGVAGLENNKHDESTCSCWKGIHFHFFPQQDISRRVSCACFFILRSSRNERVTAHDTCFVVHSRTRCLLSKTFSNKTDCTFRLLYFHHDIPSGWYSKTDDGYKQAISITRCFNYCL